MKKYGDFITILYPMVSKLKLSGNNLLVFALIHGFTKDGVSKFDGSLTYICEWLNISKNAVIDTLKVLTQCEYITKEEEYRNGVKFCYYTSNYSDLIEKLDSGCKIELPSQKTKRGGCKSEPNNIIYIDSNNNNNNNISDASKKEDKFSFKQALIDMGAEESLVRDWLIVRKKKKAIDTENAFNIIKVELEKVDANINDCLSLAVERSWIGFKAEWYNNVRKNKSSFNKDSFVNNKISDIQKEIDKKRLIVEGKEYR